MKKFIILLLLCAVLSGCASAPQNNQQVSQNEEKPSGPMVVSTGDVIETETREITITSIEFSYDVLPNDPGMFYSHYVPDSGNVYIDVSVTVKNLQKQQLNCDKVMSVKADYNDGYTYSGFAVVEKNQDFTYANITSIDPLETINMRYLVSCPQEVEEDEEGSLILILTVESVQYQINIR